MRWLATPTRTNGFRKQLRHNMKVVMSIDPGKKGAICLLYEDDAIEFTDWHDNIISDIRRIKAQHGAEIRCCIERQQAMPARDKNGKSLQGISSTFQTGQGFGKYQGALEALEISFVEIRSQKWMKPLGLPPKLDVMARKRLIAKIMQNKYPAAEFYGPRGGLWDGRSDALAMADYFRSQGG